jgi:hypothetical protein
VVPSHCWRECRGGDCSVRPAPARRS